MGWREVYGYLAKTRANSKRMCYQKHRWYHDDDNAYTLSIDQERLDNATDVREPLAHPIPPQDMSSLSSPPPPLLFPQQAEFPNGPPGWDRSAVRNLTVDRKHVISAGGSTVKVWDVNTTKYDHLSHKHCHNTPPLHKTSLLYEFRSEGNNNDMGTLVRFFLLPPAFAIMPKYRSVMANLL